MISPRAAEVATRVPSNHGEVAWRRVLQPHPRRLSDDLELRTGILLTAATCNANRQPDGGQVGGRAGLHG